MAKCAYCGTLILFGGERRGHLRFCNEECLENGVVVRIAESLPDDEVRRRALAVHQGICPRCLGPGPVDARVSYRVWSLLIMTTLQHMPMISCRSCAVKTLWRDIVFCLFFGWWSLEGMVVTPILLFRNIASLVFPPDPSQPSPALASMIRTNMAHRIGWELQREKTQ